MHQIQGCRPVLKRDIHEFKKCCSNERFKMLIHPINLIQILTTWTRDTHDSADELVITKEEQPNAFAPII